jgi:uncharacterized protein (DUF885 family)
VQVHSDKAASAKPRSVSRIAKPRSTLGIIWLVAKTKSVGIATYEEMKARTLAIARGELKPAVDDPTVWITPSVAAKAEEEGRALRSIDGGTAVGHQQDKKTGR